MVTIYDVPADALISKTAQELEKRELTPFPTWAKVVKTGAGQERPPQQDDWWYNRAASLLRKVYLRGPIGVSKLRLYYGHKKNRGTKPEEFYRGSGKIIRVILQELEKSGLIKYEQKGIRKGRVVTAKGRSLLDGLAFDLIKNDGQRTVKHEGERRTVPATSSAT